MSPTYANDGWNEIVPGLWMGGHDRLGRDDELYYAMSVRVADEFDVVISLYERDGHGPADGVEHYEHFFRDADLSDDDAYEVEQLADLAADAVTAGRRVLVRCQAGLNRSGLVTALALIRLGHKPADAIDLIRARRSPWALFNNHFVTYIEGTTR